MMRRIFSLAVLTILCAAVAADEAPRVDDLHLPTRGGPTEVKSPDRVRVHGDTVTAATAQDAINAAVTENRKELKGKNTPEVGAKMVKFPSGLGFVATGIGNYRTMENPTATRIAKRKAYVVAFTHAKKNLAEILRGLTNEGKEEVRASLVNVNLSKEEMTNISEATTESVKQAVEMLLRGFIIYEVNDDPAQHTVTVSIVTTPKTRGQLSRPTSNVVDVDTLREGLDQVIQEVRSGVVPPVGGRIVTVRKTGELAFVGFGSAVIRSSENAVVQAKLNLSARKIADMRSKDALTGLIIGDQMAWKGSVVDSQKDEVHEFEAPKAEDPLAKDDPAGARKLEQTRQSFVAQLKTEDTYVSLRKGILPPGVNTKTWFDDDHEWAFAISVYFPSLTNAAAGTAHEMLDAQILQPVRRNGNPAGRAAGTPSGFTDESNVKVKRPGATVKPGPSGKVVSDYDQ